MVKSLAFFTLFAFFAVLNGLSIKDDLVRDPRSIAGYSKKDYHLRVYAYNFVKQAMKWHDADEYCKRWGGRLVTVESAIENAYIFQEQRRRKMTSLWIGYNDNDSEGSFQWLYANHVNRWTNWRHREPNGGRRENCVEMWDGEWNDKRCDAKRDFVCHRGKSIAEYKKDYHLRVYDFKFVKQAMKWNDAEDYCYHWGGRLVTVESPIENAYILQEQRRRKMTSLWIGYNDNNSEGRFEWLYADSCNNRWTNWRRREPNGGRRENCVEMWDGKWNDKGCNVKRDFVCHKVYHC